MQWRERARPLTDGGTPLLQLRQRQVLQHQAPLHIVKRVWEAQLLLLLFLPLLLQLLRRVLLVAAAGGGG